MSEPVYSVLIVDDNRMNRLKMSRALNKGGYEVSEASGGQEAVEMLRSHVFHLVLLDILMPEIDGFQVLQRIKNDEILRRIPVIMISSLEDQEDIDKCFALGAVDFITKSFDNETLTRRVRMNLERTMN